MSAEAFLSVAGRTAARAWGLFPWSGLWVVELDIPEPVELADLGAAGAVEVRIGSTVLLGSVDPRRSGTFIDRSKVCVVAGAGGWRQDVPAKGYHNDAGVRRSEVAADAARAVGEVLEVDASVLDRQASGGILAVDFERLAGRASDVFDVLFPEVPWWADLAGVTHIGPREERPSSGVRVLSFDSRDCSAALALEGDSLAGALPGARLEDAERRVSAVVQDLEVSIASGSGTLSALCVRPGDAPARSRVLEATEVAPGPLAGLYRFRVTAQRAGRLDLQAVRPVARLPDSLLVSMHPGLAGAKGVLRPGSLVLVQFIEGHPSFPIVTHFAPSNDGRFLPLSLSIDALDLLELGKSAALVDIGSGSEIVADPTGRVVRWGDSASFPPPGPAPMTPAPGSPVAKVKA